MMYTQDAQSSMPGHKRGSVGKLVFLTMITLGVYGFYWLLQQRSLFGSLQTSKKYPYVAVLMNLLYQSFMILALVAVTGMEFADLTTGNIVYTAFVGLFAFLDAIGFIFTIVYYFALFTMRGMIEDDAAAKKYEFKSSGFLLFFFGLFYLQHIINKIPETGTMQQPPAPISAGNTNV